MTIMLKEKECMSVTISLKKRSAGNADELRAQGEIPGVVYGPGAEPVSVSIPQGIFSKLYNKVGESTLLDVSLDGEDAGKALIQDIQRDPVKEVITHVDFRRINMGVEMTASIDLNLIGEPAAVKALGGTLVKGPSYVNIKCLPKDLVSEIDVDLSVLETFDDVIQVKDLKLPEGITATDNDDIVIAKVSAPLTEEQLKAMEEGDQKSVDDIEVEEKGKAEEGEAKEEKKEDAPAADAKEEKK